MTSIQQVGLVARREFVEYSRQSAFRTGTLITVLIVFAVVAAISIVPALFGDDDGLRVGALPAAAAVAETLPAQAGETAVEVTRFEDRDAAAVALEDDVVQAVLVDGETVLVVESLDVQLRLLLQGAASTAQLAGDLGASPEEVLASTGVALAVEQLEPVDPAVAQRRSMVYFGVLAALGQVIGGAFLVANGVVEEKSSRVIEVVMAKVRPRVLLTGKLLGLGLICLVQLAALVVAGLLAVAVSPDLSIPPGLAGASGMILLWYVLSFTIFASLFSIAGALTARQEDMAQKVQPAMYVLFAVFGAAIYAFNQPDATLTTIASFFPLTAPAVMPARAAVTSVAAWETGLAMLLTLAGAAAAVWLAGSVYTGGALKLRGTSSIRDALRSAG